MQLELGSGNDTKRNKLEPRTLRSFHRLDEVARHD
jgi:hypothetical protein